MGCDGGPVELSIQEMVDPPGPLTADPVTIDLMIILNDGRWVT